MISRREQKYLKPTQAASYNPRTGYLLPPLPLRFRPGTSRLASRIRGSAKVLFADYIVGNLAVLAAFLQAVVHSTTTTQIRREALVDGLRFCFNWLLALAMLLLAAPLFLIVALAIKLDSSGPVLFMQERVGLNRRRRNRGRDNITMYSWCKPDERRQDNLYGKLFMVYKFRTMVVDAEKRCGPIWATKNDPRVTKVGRLLRKTRLDELPQLINILRGEMVLVGPRPERPHFVRKLAQQIDGYTDRLAVKPGITGLAQVENGYDSSVDTVRAKVDYDLTYIKTSSMKRDLLILLKTVGVVLGCRGM
jgi:lipopolysaccharide/colanic/teichoic acid biosynthesis glycosyltransferase